MKIDNPQYKCDYCGKIMPEPVITCEDVPYEGTSEIFLGALSYSVGGQDYCSIECLFADIKRALSPKETD